LEADVQYEVLSGLIIRFDRLSDEAQKVVTDLIDSPPDWWVGGSVGQLTQKQYEGQLSKGFQNLLSQIIKLPQKNYWCVARRNGADLFG